jgi:hypothetical protein
MDPQIQVETSYGHGGSCILKNTSNCVFHQVGALIQRVLGYLVQGFGSFPTQISKFLGFGELSGLTMPATDQLWTWGLRHIKGQVKLYILLGGRFLLRGFGIVGAGVCDFSHTNFEIFGFGGTIWTNGASHRPAMAMVVLAYSRGCPIPYSIRWRN